MTAAISPAGISASAGIGLAMLTPTRRPRAFHVASSSRAISTAPSSRRGAGSPLVRL